MKGRSRKGAWIEITALTFLTEMKWVAPVRERGLKLIIQSYRTNVGRRSRKGAWIEIKIDVTLRRASLSRSRKGAWIEITLSFSA